jgi:plastocyanin
MTPAAAATLLRCAAAAVCVGAAGAAGAAALEVQVTDAAGRPLDGAVVWIESAAARAAVKPAQNVEIAQQQRRFTPGVSVVPVGTAVAFPNRDTVRHHVYSFSPAKRFELKLYIGRPENPVLFDRAGIAVLGCNIHDEMVGWVVIVETPWFGRTAADGRVRLDVPGGAHRLRAWHAELPVGAPAADQALAVADAGTTARIALVPEAPR